MPEFTIAFGGKCSVTDTGVWGNLITGPSSNLLPGWAGAVCVTVVPLLVLEIDGVDMVKVLEN